MHYQESDFDRIQFSEVFNRLDGSKIVEYLTCPRKFFFRHILGWESIYPNKHLIYGGALHKALEFLYSHFPYNEDGTVKLEMIEAAYSEFISYYREYFGPEADTLNKPKSPEYVLPSLIAYLAEYKADWTDNEVLKVEMHGHVPINASGQEVYFRMDTVLRDTNLAVYALEHKTGSMAGQTWVDQWILAIQTLIYVHALKYNYTQENIFGIKINGIIAAKRKEVLPENINLLRVPIRFTDYQLAEGLSNLSRIVNKIHEDMHLLMEEEKDIQTYMRSFHRNPTSCTNYNTTCRFHTICAMARNPLKTCNQIPDGFKVGRWDPRDEATSEV